MSHSRLTFGIKTAPQHEASYETIARVWHEADAMPEFDHAWLWDHTLPLGGDPWGDCLERTRLHDSLALGDGAQQVAARRA